MSNTETAGMTDAELAAMDELNEQLTGASDDDPVFNIDDVVRKGQTAEDAGLLDKVEPKQEVEPEPKVEVDPAAAKVEEAPKVEEPAKVEAVPVVEEAAEAPLYQPLLVAQAPDGAAERLIAITDEKKALSAKFDDGDLTATEMNNAIDKLNDEALDIKMAVAESKMAEKLENQRITNERTLEINTFLRDVKIPNDPSNLRFKTLNQAVIEVASDPANASLGATAIMQKAHDLCVQEGVLPPKTLKSEPLSAKAKVVPPKVLNAPPTLASLPASEVSTTEENRFAHLNRMGPDAREAAFAKMSEADQTAYLSAGA
jgi:hypothetical protein